MPHGTPHPRLASPCLAHLASLMLIRSPCGFAACGAASSSTPPTLCPFAPTLCVHCADYSDDACMKKFTAGQVARMQAVLADQRPLLIAAAANSKRTRGQRPGISA